MKIIFSDLPMKKELNSFKYTTDGNLSLEYDGEVIFPINAVLAKTMKKGEKVRVILLSKMDPEGNSSINAGHFQKELNNINKNIGAVIEYVILSTPFKEVRDVQETLLRDIISKLEHGAEIYADITYGPKSLPIIVFTALNFAEKFFSADIKNIIYGKVDFVDDGSETGKTHPIDPVMYDLTPLYYLNNVINVMEYKTSEEALKALEILLEM